MNVFKMLTNKVKNLDIKIKKIMHFGFIFSFILSIIAILTLCTYDIFYSIPVLFYAGISLFRTSLMFACTFFICGIGFDSISKELG